MQTIEAIKTFEKLYTEKKYEDALEFLKKNKIFEDNIQTFNLGLINFNLQNYSRSKLLLEKVKTLGFESEVTNDLIKKSDFSLGIAQAQRPETIKDHIISNTEAINVDVLLISSLIATLIVLIKIQKIYGIFLRISTLMIFLIPLSWSIVYKLNYKTYVSLEDKEIHSGPSQMFDDTFPLPEGIKYTISKTYKDWGYITYPDKYSGWIKIDNEERI